MKCTEYMLIICCVLQNSKYRSEVGLLSPQLIGPQLIGPTAVISARDKEVESMLRAIVVIRTLW